jgi:hypothetical protein
MDGQYLVQYDLGGSPDMSSTTISCTRDLEDYTRLGIQLNGIDRSLLTNGTVVVKLESGPQIQIFPAAAGNSTAYLTDSNTAQRQISSPYNQAIGTAGTYQFPPSYWTNYPTAYFLFDGTGGGNGNLKVSLYAADEQGTLTKFAESDPLYLNLQDVKSMYEAWTVGEGNGGTPASTASDYNGFQYSSSSPETGQYILFVHGWNINATEKDYFANTAYKRLWWQGYKGRFGAFRWPTTYGFGSLISIATDARNFDNGEFAAWQSAAGLAAKLNDLNSLYPNNVYLFAHSMGNVVASEALKLNNGTGNGVNAYAACQAAVSAHAYDSSTTGWESSSHTADSFATYPLTGVNYFSGVSSAGSRANFFNQNDYALTNWITDQYWKPDHGVAFPGYYYDFPPSSHPTGYYYIITPNSYDLYFPTDRYKIFAYCVQSPCYAMGATANVAGFTPVNLAAGLWPPDPFAGHNYSTHPWHSAEFLFSTVEQSSWWGNLMGAFFPH